MQTYTRVGYDLTTATFKLPCRGGRHRRRPPVPRKCVVECGAISKRGQRFLSSLAITIDDGDIKSSNRLMKKFVDASPKSIVIDALSHLLNPHSSYSRLSSLAFPLYMKIAEARWFDWNSKIVADLVAVLDKQGQHSESADLISDSISRVGVNERDLALFCCNLVESYSKHASVRGFDDSLARLKQLVCNSNSVYVKKQGYKSMVNGLCQMGRPKEAEILMEEMRGSGIKLTLFEFRCLIYSYGSLGQFKEMNRVVEQIEKGGLKIDTVCANMILASLGAHNAHSEMAEWLQKLKGFGIPLSLRTFNSVLNSCSTITSIVQDSNDFPISVRDLMKILSEDEAILVKELVESSLVLNEAMKWDAVEGKLDLHGMHLCSAYLIMLMWIEEMRERFNAEDYVIPKEITVVCGAGNHSIIRGESPVKNMVKKILIQTRSPLRIDRRNIGCFIAKGHLIKEWLS